jgi:hypothetical protein
VTIAGRVHPAMTCLGCGDLVPVQFAYEGRHVTCPPAEPSSPELPAAAVVHELRPADTSEAAGTLRVPA